MSAPETNSTTRLAMLRAVKVLYQASTVVGYSVEQMAEILERESGYRELYEALEEMLKHGQHEGPCDNEEDSLYDSYSGACSLHLATSEVRSAKARAALAKARGESAR